MDNGEYVPNQEDQKEKLTLAMIQDIKDGALNPKMLSEDEIHECIDFLMSEGYTQAQIGQILMRSDRTIRRDLVSIRKKHARTADINLAKQTIGDMFRKGMASNRYLVRLARSPEASISERAQAEFLSWRVLKEVVEKMQTLGYLPLKPQEIIEDVFHHVQDMNTERSISEAKGVLADIESAAKAAGTLDTSTEDKIKALKSKIEQAEINHEVDKIAKKEDQPNEEGTDES